MLSHGAMLQTAEHEQLWQYFFSADQKKVQMVYMHQIYCTKYWVVSGSDGILVLAPGTEMESVNILKI